MDQFEVEDERQAQLIAADWEIGVELLEETIWDLEEITGNEGEVYGFLVRFDEGSNEEVLAQIGLSNGDMTREVNLNAFDEPEVDTTIEEISGARVVDNRSTRAKRWTPLTGITVRNFKAAKEANIPLGNVTILVGQMEAENRLFYRQFTGRLELRATC